MSDPFRDPVPPAEETPRAGFPARPDLRPFGAPRPGLGRRPGILPAAARVLVVDDEPFVVRVVERLLLRAGYRTASALDAPAALDLVRQAEDPFDLLVADLSLSGGGGAGLLRRVRALHPGLPVLFMRGRMVEAPSPEPAAPVLTKPFGSRQLYATVAGLLEGVRGAGNGAAAGAPLAADGGATGSARAGD